MYLRARYYDPNIGRFITKDTFTGFATNPKSLNRYTYAYNNPVNLIDPSGHSPLEGTGSTWLNRLNFTLDIIGLFPGIGEPADGLNAIIYAMQGDRINASLSAGSMIPFAGLLSTGGKFLNRADDLYGVVKGAGKVISPSNAAKQIVNAERTGTALIKSDPTHRAASYLTEKQLTAGKTFPLQGGDGVQRTLLQTPGGFNGKSGIYEYILEPNGMVSHQRFIGKGIITGTPNQVVKP